MSTRPSNANVDAAPTKKRRGRPSPAPGERIRALELAIQNVRAEGKKPTEENVAEKVRPNAIAARTIREWLEGGPSFPQLVASMDPSADRRSIEIRDLPPATEQRADGARAHRKRANGQGSIYQREKDGQIWFVATLRRADGSRRELWAKTRAAVETKLAAVLVGVPWRPRIEILERSDRPGIYRAAIPGLAKPIDGKTPEAVAETLMAALRRGARVR